MIKELDLPWLVTITLDVASGTLIPAARNVKPITESGMVIVSPIIVIIQETK